MNALQLSPQDVTDFYTPLITDLMAVTQSMAGVIEDAQMLQAILSYVGVLEGKERSGHERSAGTLGFGSGGFSPELYRDFTRLAAMQEVFFRALQESGHADDIAAFEAVMSGPAGVAVSELRMLVSRDPSGPQIAAVSPAQWFEAATQRIDELKALEDQMSQRIADTASANLAVAQRNFWMLAGVLAALIVLTGFVSFFVAKSIAPPIRKLAATMRELAANNFKVTVEDTWRTDEIGDMAKAVEIFRENGIDRINLEKRAQSERDHERMRQVHIEKIVSSFRTQIAASSNEVVGHTDAMRSLAERLLGVARTAAQDAQSAHTASNGASSNVQTVAAATEELSASIREIAGQTHRVSTLMDSAAQRADATNADVAKLSEAAKHIGAVIGLISDIAEQTNLLALNATIEAARAGEAGRGFAVVASEVKELATQTARATEEISQQIAGIQASTTGAVDSIGSITRAVNEIRELTTAIAGAVEEQEAATQEIANSVGAASNGTESAASNVESVSRSIENTAEEAKTVNATADLLAGTSASLLENVENFLAQVSRDVDDRRGALRVKMSEIIVICAAGRRRRSTMLDASKTGAKIAPVEGVQIGDEVKVELADGSTVTGKARRFAEGGIGIEFSEAIDDPVSFIGQGFHDEKAA